MKVKIFLKTQTESSVWNFPIGIGNRIKDQLTDYFCFQKHENILHRVLRKKAISTFNLL